MKRVLLILFFLISTNLLNAQGIKVPTSTRFEMIQKMNNLDFNQTLDFILKDIKLDIGEAQLDLKISDIERLEKNLFSKESIKNNSIDNVQNHWLENLEVFSLDNLQELSKLEAAMVQQAQAQIKRINVIGELGAKVPAVDKVLDEAIPILKQFQTKHNLNPSGLFDEATRSKVAEIEQEIWQEFKLLAEDLEGGKKLGETISIYQEKHGLQVDNIYNEEVRKHISDRKSFLKSTLEEVIFDAEAKSLVESIVLYKQIKAFDESTPVADAIFLKSLEADNNLYIKTDESYTPFEKSNIQITNVEGEEIKSLNTIRYVEDAHVHVAIDNHIGKTIESINKKLDWNYDRDEMVIFPMTTNGDTRALLKKDYNKSWIKSSLTSEADIFKKLSSHKRKTVFMVGHREGEFYVENNQKIISIDKLNEYAKKQNLNIFHLGCSTGEIDGKVGTVASINTYHTINGLIPTIKANSNFKNLLLDFSKKRIGADKQPVDLLISTDTFSDKGYVKVKMYKKTVANTAATLGGMLTLYYLSDKEEKEEEPKTKN